MLQLMNFFPVHYFVWRCGPSGPLPTPAQVKTQLGFMEPELWLHRRCSEHLGILTHFKVKNCTNSFIREVYYYEYHYLHQWRRKWQPTPVLLPRKSHGGRSLVGYSPWGCRVRHDWATSLSLSFRTGTHGKYYILPSSYNHFYYYLFLEVSSNIF